MGMIMVYKITHGISGCPFENFFTINNYMSTRNNGLKFINIIATLMSESILFLKESSMTGTPFQVT